MNKKDKPQASDNKKITLNNINDDNKDKLCKKRKKKKGDGKMATIPLDSKIVLNNSSAKALVDKIEEDIKSNAVFESVDIQKKIEEGMKVLKQFLSR